MHSRGCVGAVWTLAVLLAAAVGRSMASDDRQEAITPLLLSVHDAPVPFTGSDGRIHLAYELWLVNFSSGDVAIEKVEVLGEGTVLATLNASEAAGRLQPAGVRDSLAGVGGAMAKSTTALLFLHVILPPGTPVPKQISHRITLRASAAPPGHERLTEEGGAVEVDQRKVVVIGPPLKGERYVAADSCCDAFRHTRAALPVNGRVWVTQRFAVDWEQLDSSGRTYSGPREDVKSYTIFGQPVLAAADAVVESVTDGLPEQTPGKYPTNIPIDQADGNSVILNLGDGNYAVYAHLQPGSLRVKKGDRVTRGQVLGLVGNTGNSVEPHLHFHVMDGPLPLASNGLPYEIDAFEVTGKTPGTAGFDEADEKGTPVPVTPFEPAQPAKDELPLDQLVIKFANQ